MERILGDKDTLARVREAKSGDPHVYVNLDAIQELPEQYEAVVEKVKFDFDTDFVEVGGGNYMPTPKLMNDIGEARGIAGTDGVRIESITEDVDINPMLCRPPDAEPTIRRIIVGKRVIKIGRVQQEDGTWRTSDPCSVDFNVWERCLIEWSKEEETTNGYDKALAKRNQAGSLYWEFEWYDKITKETKKGSIYPKYDNRFKRQRHFAELMKFAQRQADTKARNIVIRVLAGLKTAYRKDELKDGYFIFPRIRRSRDILNLETAADLQARARGLTGLGDDAQALLFGPTVAPAPQEDEFPPTEPPKAVSKREHMLAILQAYRKDALIVDELKTSGDKLIAWLEGNAEAEQDDRFWPKAVNTFRAIEEKIPEQMRIDHKIF